MTTILKTPPKWPSILLGRTPAAAASAPEVVDLDAATKAGAFAGLTTAVRELGPEGVIGAVAASGLRGRGGAAFPTGEKWRICATTEARERFVVANGYGADPASRTDATLMEHDPFAVVEGTAIAAFAVGAAEAIIAVRATETTAIRRLEAAIGAAEEAGYIGPDMLGTGNPLTITVRPVQGAYMLGEETVLLKALEGKRGQPEQRPPHPAQEGLFGSPTVVNNVQTLAAVPWILRNGGTAFSVIGSNASPGTALVALRGPSVDGVAEVPTGTSLRDVIALAGDLPRGRRLKAVLVGGPSGGLLPADQLDTPYEFDALRAAGAHVGSGSVVIADDRACIVDLARLLTRFCSTESCGKTIPCRIGVRRLWEIGDRMAEGRSKPTDAQLLTDLSHDIVESGLCDHERLSTLPLMSGMRYFRPELDEHLLRGACPAGVCQPIAMASASAQ